jgi:transposase, IS5 family
LQLAPAVQRVKKRAGRTPGTVTADRGYGEAKVDEQLTDLGVKDVVIPPRGKPSQARRAEEHRKSLPPHVKWRTGSEGRISYLKRGFGWDRTPHRRHRRRSDLDRTRVLAHNLVKISALAG